MSEGAAVVGVLLEALALAVGVGVGVLVALVRGVAVALDEIERGVLAAAAAAPAAGWG